MITCHVAQQSANAGRLEGNVRGRAAVDHGRVDGAVAQIPLVDCAASGGAGQTAARQASERLNGTCVGSVTRTLAQEKSLWLRGAQHQEQITCTHRNPLMRRCRTDMVSVI